MSNAIRYDSLLLAAVARGLHASLAGRAVRGIWLDRGERSLLVRLAAPVRRQPDTYISWLLHPTAGDLVIDDAPREPAGAIVQIAPGTILRAVRSLPDERILEFQLDAGDAAGGFARRIVVEFIGSRWNAIAIGADDAIMGLLQLREREDTVLRPGARYSLPTGHARSGSVARLTLAGYDALLRTEAAAQEDLRRALVRDVAYTSPMNATYVIAPLITRVDDAAMLASWKRYTELLDSDAGFVLHDGRGQPYTSAMGRADVTAETDILSAFARVAATAPAATEAPAGSAESAIAAVHERIRRIDARISMLDREHRDAAEEASLMRRQADLLFAQLDRVKRGAGSADLDDFEGGTLHVELDPATGPRENAAALHDRAKRRELAEERVPAIIAKARAEIAKLEELKRRLIAGVASADEVARWSAHVKQAKPNEAPVLLPYRCYRTSSGLEIRAGRNSRANDQLTFHHSAPEDIWLHARDLSGAHVILRWSQRDTNPPAHDLMEAAIIAAVNSRGRTSGIVPVDWTRRKYVRKPRKSPAGQVIIERAKTLFAEPDAQLERSLRADDELV